MNQLNSDWLSQLAPDHAPPPLSGWLIAPGWWGLLLLLFIVLIILGYWLRHPTQRLRRAALRELKHLETTITDSALLARDLEHLLRRYALVQFGHDAVAKLSGEAWISFVVAHGGTAFEGETGKDLLRAAYGGRVNADRIHWFNGARGFLKGKGRK